MTRLSFSDTLPYRVGVEVMRWQKRIAISPRVQGGRPVIRGTRVPVEVLAGAVAAGDPIDQVADDYRVTVADVRAALSYAADLVASEVVLGVRPRRRRTERCRSPR